jgi:pilus assembly protein CpaE
MNVSVLASSDKQLIDLVRGCGMHATPLSVDGLATLAQPAARQPDVIVVDQRDHDAILPEILAIKRLHPLTGVLMVLPRLDGARLLEAMRAGVNECVPEPVTRQELYNALQRIAAQRPAPKRGDVFAIIGAKGGIGATTVAVNVAATLNTLRPSSALLMDLHMTYGDAGVFLGAEPRFSIVDALEHMERMDATFLRSLMTQTKSGLHLLPSSERAVSVSFDAARLQKLVALAAAEFAYVVLDVPRSDATALDSLESAGTIIVVANQDVATVRTAGRLAATLEQRYGKERVSVVITRFDANSEIGQPQVERVVGRPVSSVFPNNYQVALAALNQGRPLVLDNHTKLASAIMGFARQISGIPAEPPQKSKSKPSGLFGLLGARRSS